MQVLIIEDEPRAANQLQSMLKATGFEYQLLGIIDTVEDTVQWIQHHPSPELIFMDIQLADGLSFEVFQKVEVQAPIIFTTAFDQYAIQAFKVNSVDYLLKPIQKEDLRVALNKFSKTKGLRTVEPAILKELLNSMRMTNRREGILVKEGNSFVQIRLSDMLYAYSEDSITFGVTKEKRYMINETIDQLFNSLDKERFYRINRGQIIAKNAIKRIAPYYNHRVKLTIGSPRDQEFIVSRDRTSDFKQWMNR
ncbi:LytR/AlgR family response regulator transcription factor [Sungkyunkwania multivorans]|uniref:LytR/AlgR family response regulator transcription factor n=1 Tax=Sungkyunkwania multivorans TaxID=1173618 RepID=A0ABW3CWC3_9FLAO